MADVTREEVYRVVLDAPTGLVARMPADPDTSAALKLLDLVSDLLRGVVERQERARQTALQEQAEQRMR